MKTRFLILILHVFISGIPHSVAAEKNVFRFSVIAQANEDKAGAAELLKLLTSIEEKKFAFIVANGIKSAGDPCTDEFYNERREIFEGTKIPLVPSLTANDWAECVTSSGKPAAVERLNRVRELFFSEKSSFGDRKVALIRQSTTPQFRSYSENSRWRFRNILFATIHLPSNNNNYIAQAGRNNEFEDRLIANRDWLQKLFIFARRKKLDGIVLFSDGNPLMRPTREELAKLKANRDGFLETRQHILKLAAGFPGKILIVHRQAAKQEASSAASNQIRWSRNVGETGIAAGISQIAVIASPELFALIEEPLKKKEASSEDQP